MTMLQQYAKRQKTVVFPKEVKKKKDVCGWFAVLAYYKAVIRPVVEHASLCGIQVSIINVILINLKYSKACT